MDILLIDDDPVIRSLVGEILLSLGHKVVTAQNGAEGLQFLSGELPQIVFLDYQLPDMSGLDVLRKVRDQARTHELPVVLLSASDDQDTKTQACQAGADTYLEKPFKLDDFVRVLASLST